MIFYDQTGTVSSGLNTGIQRVVRQLGHALAEQAPDAVVPVILRRAEFLRMPLETDYAKLPTHPIRQLARRIGSGSFRTVRNWCNANRFLFELKAKLWEFLQFRGMPGTVIRPKANDWYLTADAIWNWPQILDKLGSLKDMGVRTAVVHHDLTPVTHPRWYDPALRRAFLVYAEVLVSFDIVFCISEIARQEFLKFCRQRGCGVLPTVVTVPMGYEITRHPALLNPTTRQVPDDPFVLCVGTLEPRKNHGSLLDAFEILWEKSVDMSVVIVGRPGYASEVTLARIRRHPRFGRNLFYLPKCSDEELEQLYSRCAFTVLSSFFEGFGLPLVESLARGKPCICSNIQVFRDTAGKFGVYINPEDPRSIATQIEILYSDRKRLESLTTLIRSEYSPPSWKDCAQVILQTLGYTRAAVELKL